MSSLASICLATLILSTTTYAYERYAGSPSCDDCHPGFVEAGALHNVHVGGSAMTVNCGLCHVVTGDNPLLDFSGAAGGQSCRGCHGVDNGTVSGWGAGLRLHHANAGAPPDANGDFCVDCHPGDPTPDPESTLPVYYTRGDVNITDPCVVESAAGGEDWDGDNQGLDNDGDLLYETNDSDCGANGVGDLAQASELRLEQGSPNPFRDVTTIGFTAGRGEHVRIDVFDVIGHRVRTLVDRPFAGDTARHSVGWDARGQDGRPVPAGVYFCRMEVDGARVETRKVMVAR